MGSREGGVCQLDILQGHNAPHSPISCIIILVLFQYCLHLFPLKYLSACSVPLSLSHFVAYLMCLWLQINQPAVSLSLSHFAAYHKCLWLQINQPAVFLSLSHFAAYHKVLCQITLGAQKWQFFIMSYNSQVYPSSHCHFSISVCCAVTK